MTTQRRRRPGALRAPRGRPRWGLRIAAGVSVGVLATAGVGHAVVTGLETGISRVDPFHGLDHRPAGSAGQNILLVGTDGRDAITPDQKRRYHLGGTPCHCSDTIMLVHLSADRKRASVVSIPRDSYAELPAYTDPRTGTRHPARPEKLNAAYARGGPQLTVRTVEKLTRVHIDHYFEVDFTGFMRTVDVVGGVRICTTHPLKDAYTGLNLPAGTSTLGGGQALQYVRSRHLDSGSDLGRMQRQQRFLAALVNRVASSGVLLNPVAFHQVAAALLGSLRADRGFGMADMLALGQALRGLTPASSEFATVPVRSVGHPVPGVGSTVLWDARKAARLFGALRADRPLAVHHPQGQHAVVVDVPPQQIPVQVENGTPTQGLGQEVDRALRATGFATTRTPRNADRTDIHRTVIAYDPGWDRSARSLAAALPGAELQRVEGQGARMRVTVGTDFRHVRPVRADQPRQDGQGFSAVTGDEVSCH